MSMVAFTLTYPEFKQALRLIERQQPRARASIAIHVVTLVAALGLAAYLLIVRRYFGHSPTAASHASDTMIGMLIFGYVGWRAFDLFDGRFKRQWQRAGSLRQPQSVERVGDALRFTAGKSTRSVPIASYRKAIESKDVVVLIAERGADVLPARAVDEALRETIDALSRT